MMALGHGSSLIADRRQAVEDDEELHEQRRAPDDRHVEPGQPGQPARPDNRIIATTRAMTSPIAMEARASGIDATSAPDAIGQSDLSRRGRGRTARYSLTSWPKYFSLIAASVPSAFSSASASSIAVHEVVAALGGRRGPSATTSSVVAAILIAGRLVGVGLHVVEEGQLVVDRRVDAALLEEGDRLGPALDDLRRRRPRPSRSS